MLRLGSILLVVFAAAAGVRAGNTTCKTTSLDWYTQSVGETPCRTYERLRQTCNSGYQVGNFGPDPPGNQCTDQVSACCCNSVAFALSMLCENCQYGLGSGVNGDTGFDGAAGTYQFYLGSCGAGTNQSLPNVVQTAVCNQGMKIPKSLYELFWGDGAWFYIYTRDSTNLQIQSGTNTTKFCNGTTTSSSSVGIPTSSTSPSSSPNTSSGGSSGPNIGAIVGGVVGGLGVILVAALVFWFSRRRRSRGSVDLGEEKEPDMMFEPYVDHAVGAQPQQGGPGPISQGAPSSYTYTSASSDIMSASTSAPAPTPRPTKAGMIAHSPPNREEVRPPMIGAVSSTYSSTGDRHEDSIELSSAFGLARSGSGRLPPTYQER